MLKKNRLEQILVSLYYQYYKNTELGKVLSKSTWSTKY